MNSSSNWIYAPLAQRWEVLSPFTSHKLLLYQDGRLLAQNQLHSSACARDKYTQHFSHILCQPPWIQLPSRFWSPDSSSRYSQCSGEAVTHQHCRTCAYTRCPQRDLLKVLPLKDTPISSHSDLIWLFMLSSPPDHLIALKT